MTPSISESAMVESNQSTPNLYDAIGVNADASAEKIKRKTRKLINDVKESDNRNSKKNELIRFFKGARETLTDRDAREEYDRSIGIETISSSNEQTESMVPFDHDVDVEHQHDPFHPSILGALGALSTFGPIGSIGSIGPVGPLGPVGAVRSIRRIGSMGTVGSGSASASTARAADSPGPLSLVGMLGADIQDMFSNSIVPEELSASSCVSGGLKPGNFQVLEYTKVRNPGGGFDEFGYTRHGDLRNDRVTEKRFERKS